MGRIVVLFILVIGIRVVFAQGSSPTPTSIRGEVTGHSGKIDTVYFTAGLIDQKYFDRSMLSSEMINGTFNINTEASVPQMYRVLFSSDKSIRIRRPGRYFLEASSSYIKTDFTEEECNDVSGETAREFRNKFIPFIFKDKRYDCSQTSLEKLVHSKSTQYDSLLFRYTLENPNSYVALWHVIERFSIAGHTSVLEETLDLFSEKIKSERVWRTLKEDVDNVLIKEHKVFPAFPVKTVNFSEDWLSLPRAQFTLIDFWFSRCRPCIETFPMLKDLYSQYQQKGFEIVSISTDRTEDVSLWKKRIKEHDLPWKHYLDENGVQADKVPVNIYPATFLLNAKGEVIKKDLTPEQLKTFLNENLN